MRPPSLITSDDVNYLVFRYLLESGFTHTTFAFQQECAIHTRDYHHHHQSYPNSQPPHLRPDEIRGSKVPPGALITYLQKGLQYVQVETHTNEDGSQKRCSVPFSLVCPHECEIEDGDDDDSAMVKSGVDANSLANPTATSHIATPAASSSKRIKKEIDTPNSAQIQPSASTQSSNNNANNTSNNNNNSNSTSSGGDWAASSGIGLSKSNTSSQNNNTPNSSSHQNSHTSATATSTGKRDRKDEHTKVSTGGSSSTSNSNNISSSKKGDREKRSRKDSVAVDDEKLSGMTRQASYSGTSSSAVIGSNEVTILDGHKGEVYACSWNPRFMLMATGSGDGTVRIWKVPGDASEPPSEPIVLVHSHDKESRDVATLAWNHNGLLLATGCYDGHARIWTKSGDLKFDLRRHSGPVFSVKWNKKGDLLLTGSMDQTAIIWDTVTGEHRQQFAFHDGPVLDVDWKDDTTFATCSNDNTIYVCRIGVIEPLRVYTGHQAEINTIRWEPSGSYLASGSDDSTAKIWTSDSDSALWNLTGHTKEIYAVRWAPSQSSNSSSLTTSNQPPARRLLASSSFDSTIRLWDASNGNCLSILTDHSEPVYSVAFSPDGIYMATGSFDCMLYVWRVKDGSLIKSYKGKSGIYQIGWGAKGDKLSACYGDGTVVLAHIPSLRDRS